MPFCRKCGSHLSDNDMRCPSCGAKQSFNSSSRDFKKRLSDIYSDIKSNNDFSFQFDRQDIAQNKLFAACSYLGILIILPIFAARNSKFVRFHLNQAVVLIISEFALSAVSKLILGTFLLVPIIELIVLAGRIFGVINSITGKAIEIPLIGKLRIFR